MAPLNSVNSRGMKGEKDGATLHREPSRPLGRTDAGWFCEQGDALYREKRFEEALRVFNQALAIDPVLEIALYVKGNCAIAAEAPVVVGRGSRLAEWPIASDRRRCCR